jgi:dephospho-CoA kinase
LKLKTLNLKKIGVTGGIGSGKSTVCSFFKLYGVPVYDADSRAKYLMTNDQGLRNEIISLLGRHAYSEGTLNRTLIAEKVFNDKELLGQLNNIVHPVVADDFKGWAASMNPRTPYLIKEAALLFETGSYKELDKTILVTAPVEVRIRRVKLRDNISSAKIKARMDNQLNDVQKIPMADFVIFNDGIKPLIRQVAEIHMVLLGN